MGDSRWPTLVELLTIEAVRKRPGMYIGSTDFFGLINYLVCPVALLLGRRASRIAVAVQDGGFAVEADVALPIESTSSGRLAPFEEISDSEQGHGFEGTVLNALSESLTVEVQREGRTETLAFRRGTREAHHESSGASEGPTTMLRFAPDTSIFTVTSLSPEIFKSYLRRLSFLHPGVRFSLAFGGESHEFHADRGLVDLFTAVSAPYQILHEPIQFVAEDGPLRLEAAFAYQSWTERALWCYINNGRAVEGGTHEKGLADALKAINKKIVSSESRTPIDNGIVGVVSIRYPDAVWEGCIKARIGNPELRGMVKQLFVQGTADWLQSRPDVFEQLQHVRVFSFPDAWYT